MGTDLSQLKSNRLNLSQLLRHRWGQAWLIGADNGEFWQSLTENLQTLEKQHFAQPPLLLVQAPAPAKRLAQFFAALVLGHPVLLTNPQWGEREWSLVSRLHPTPWPENSARDVSLTLKQGISASQTDSSSRAARAAPGILQPPLHLGTNISPSGSAVLIPTGGTSGRMKFVIHTEQTLMASVQGFQAHFRVYPVHAYCVLPMFHVSGLMQALRVLMAGGTLALQPYRDLKQGRLLPSPDAGFLSLVPTQLQYLLDQGEPYLTWMKKFRAVLLGGAPAWPSLLEQARQHSIPLAPTYGMTETASQVATLLPEEFLAGARGSGKPLPHAQLRVLSPQRQPLAPNQVGQIAIMAKSLALGYVWPEPRPHCIALDETAPPTDQQPPPLMAEQPSPDWLSIEQLTKARSPQFLTDDMGYLDAGGNLHITGRCSTKIITGGENVFPEEVEVALLASDGVQDVCIVGLPDQRWGQRLCAVMVLQPGCGTLADLAGAMKPHLAGYKCPKDWIQVEALPRTAQGKVNRKLTLELAQHIFNQHIFKDYACHSVP